MPSFTRAIVIVLDGVGVGALPDASRYGDAGTATLPHVAARVPLNVPHLRALGLGRVAHLGGEPGQCTGAFGKMAEASAGKDSITGHWELMGVVVDRPFPVFADGFPQDAIDKLSAATGHRIIGNLAFPGTSVLDAFGEQHLRTGALILYTSADSVCQIAAHESVLSPAELYLVCETAFEIFCRGLGVARVIARPFIGMPGAFVRTAGRRDFALPPPGTTLFDRLSAAGTPVVAIGKIDDLFGGRGLSRAVHTESDDDGMNEVVAAMDVAPDGGMIMATLVDFDTKFGHRNDADGFAANLERFDHRLGTVLACLRTDDLLVITADHGNDPTTPGTDHTREYVPLLAGGPGVPPGRDLGTRATFSDLGQTLAELYDVPPLSHGTSFLQELTRS